MAGLMIDVLAPEEQEGTKAVVRNWLKAVGDRVAPDDPLVELETDKVTQEIPAPAAGILPCLARRNSGDPPHASIPCSLSAGRLAPGFLLQSQRPDRSNECLLPDACDWNQHRI